MFGLRLWHPADRAKLSFLDAEAMFRTIDRRVTEEQAEARKR